MKPILPTLREKKRYVAFEIVSRNKIKAYSSVSKAIWQAALAYAGELGTSRAGLWLIPERWDAQKQRGILRVNHKHVDHARSSLALVKKIEDQPVICRSRGVSGILKKASQKYIAG